MNLSLAAHRRDPITVLGEFAIADGYGSMNEYMVRGMARAGADVNPWPSRIEPEGLSEEFLDLLARSRPHLDGPLLVTGTVNNQRDLECIVGPDLFVRQAWETDRFPPHWLPNLNRCCAIIATSGFVVDVLRNNGLFAPVEVVPDGVDPDVYHYEHRPQRDGLTTLVVGRADARKNHDKALAGWQLAFEHNPTARLMFKIRRGDTNFTPPRDDARIRRMDKEERTRGIVSWYRQADVLLALGSEGTGLPMLEAMATGLPVIALASAGQSDVCAAASDAVLPVRPAGREELVSPYYGAVGTHDVPDVTDVAAQLRWVAHHRDEAAEMGRRASDWVRQNRNVWNYGPDILTVVAEHGRRRRRPRGRSDRAGYTDTAAAATNEGHR